MKTMMRAVLGVGLLAGVAVAQNPPAPQPKPAPQPGQMRGPGPMNRQMIEQQIRNRIGNQVKKNLNLTDDQFAKLQATNKKFEERRRLLNEQERDARMAMRDLMISGDTANAAKINAGIDKMLQLQRQRFDILDQEQKEVAAYLSPMQRARFLAMQEQFRRRIDGLRAQAGRRGPNAPMARPGRMQGMRPGMGPGMMGEQPGAMMRRNQRPLRQGPPAGNAPPAPQPPVGN